MWLKASLLLIVVINNLKYTMLTNTNEIFMLLILNLLRNYVTPRPSCV